VERKFFRLVPAVPASESDQNSAHTYMGNIQVLQNNKLKWIDWNGEELKKTTFFQGHGIPESIIEVKSGELKINKTNNIHYLIDKSFYNYNTQIVKNDSISLINANDIDEFYFIKNNSLDRIINRNLKNNEINLLSPKGLMYFRYNIVYYKKNNG
jgi:hypothetical protein